MNRRSEQDTDYRNADDPDNQNNKTENQLFQAAASRAFAAGS